MWNKSETQKKKVMYVFVGNILILYNAWVFIFIKSPVSFKMLIGDLSREQQYTILRVTFSIQKIKQFLGLISCRKIFPLCLKGLYSRPINQYSSTKFK
jgi:hypothetical protein